MGLTNKIDPNVLGAGSIGRWPYGGSIAVPEPWDGKRSNLGDEQSVRGNLFTRVVFGEAADPGDVMMFDELYGAQRDDEDDAFGDGQFGNGARKIRSTWTDGPSLVKCGVVVGVPVKAGDVGYVQRRGTCVIKIRRDTETMDAETFSQNLGADEANGVLTVHATGAKFNGFRFNGLTAAGAANTTGEIVADICDPGGILDTNAAQSAQPSQTIPVSDRLRPAYG